MSTRTASILLAALLALVAWYAFHEATDNEFIWDDPIVLQQQLPFFQNEPLKTAFFPPKEIPQWADRYYRPVIVVSYLIDEWAAKTFWKAEERDRARAVTFHASCVVYHVVATLLVFMLGLMLHRWSGVDSIAGVLTAAIAGLLFAVHPIHVESVAWMAGRSDLVCAVFVLTALICYLAMRQAKSIGTQSVLLAGSLSAALGAMLCKETALALLVIVPLFDLLAHRAQRPDKPAASRAERRRAAREPGQAWTTLPVWLTWGCLFGVTVVYWLMRRAALGAAGTKPLRVAADAAERLFGAIGWYLVKAIWPPPQSAFESQVPGGIYLALGVLVPLAALVFVWRARKQMGSAREVFSVVLFFSTLAPSLAIALYRISETPLAERYLYLPSIGLCLLVAFLLERVGRRLASPWMRTLVPAVVALAIAVPALDATLERGAVWQNNMAFWTDTVAKEPDQGLPHLHLGITYSEQNRDRAAGPEGDEWERKAIAEYQKALETYDDNEGRSKSHNNMGSSYMALRDYDKAIEHFKQATQIDTRYPNAHYNWAMALLSKQVPVGQDRLPLIQEAVEHFETALRFNPRYVKAHLQYGNLMVRLGQVEKGRQHLEQAMQLAPASFEGKKAKEILEQLR